MKAELAQKILAKQSELKTWYSSKGQEASIPFYSSVDIRDADFKVVSVDCNLYPAGFNNICYKDQIAASPLVKRQFVSELGKEPRRILVIPENNTKNKYYIENLYYLVEILQNTGAEVRIGWYPIPTEKGPITLESQSGKKLEAYPIEVAANRLKLSGFNPDVILLNNDFSSGYPQMLEGIEQKIIPSYRIGWHTRKKSEHFRYYNQLVEEFSNIIEFDPWRLSLRTELVEPVDFNEDEGTEKVAQAVERVLTEMKKAYDDRGIDQEPFAFVKSNQGTYGMGVMAVRSPDELKSLNRRAKNKMSTGKNRIQINSVVVQEGVPTKMIVNRLPAEPVIYAVGCELIGGFLRANEEKSSEENLNAKGMVFKTLCMSDLQALLEEKVPSQGPEDFNDRLLELAYGSIARLAALAAGREIRDQVNN